MFRLYTIMLISFVISTFGAASHAAEILGIGAAEVCGSFNGVRPSIDVDSKGQPHIIIDSGHIALGSTIWMFNKINGTWSGRLFADRSTTPYAPSAISQPWIEIDAMDRAWVFAQFFQAGVMRNSGQGVWLYENMASSPTEKWFNKKQYGRGWGPGNLQIDPHYPNETVVMTMDGYWGIVNDAGVTTSTGQMGPRASGEKFRFRISPQQGQRGIWHGVMNGSRAGGSSAYRNSVMGSDQIWATYNPYSSQGDDHNHPGVCNDLENPKMAYIASVYEQTAKFVTDPPGLSMQIYDGNGNMIFGTDNLLMIDPHAKFVHRCPPAMAPAHGGGVWIAWPDEHGQIKMTYVSPEGEMNTPAVITSGAFCGINTDSEGNVHMAYVESGQTKYRKISVSGLIKPEYPIGRTYDRSPTFGWEPFEGTTDLKLFYWPKDNAAGNVVEISVTGNSHTIETELNVGRWEWMLTAMYEGNPVESTIESFSIPPSPPQPAEPANRRFGAGEETPTFTWTDTEQSPWYRIEVRKYASDGISSELVDQKWTRELEWTPGAGLGNGNFTWNIYAYDGRHSPPLYSDWSEGKDFQIGVPGKTEFTEPASDLVYTNALPEFAWKAADSETNDTYYTWYQLYVIRDGRVINNVNQNGSGWFTEKPDQGLATLTLSNGILRTSSNVGALKPGEYSLWVRPMDATGYGPWSEAHRFIVNRVMEPGTVGARLGYGQSIDPAVTSRPRFTWTDDPDAAWYNMILVKDGIIIANKWIQINSWTPSSDLATGSYRWWVRSYHFSNGYQSPWLDGAAFQMGLPSKSKMLAPSGAQNDNTPSFKWRDASGADGYKLWYQINGQPETKKVVPIDGTSYTPESALSPGDYKCWVASSNEYGEAWSDPANFEIK